MPFYRNTQAEMVDNSGTNETICLNKVSEMRSKCGNGSSFAVIFGPTGNSDVHIEQKSPIKSASQILDNAAPLKAQNSAFHYEISRQICLCH